MNTVILYLVRHGAIVSGPEKSFIGQIDPPLSTEGIAQARALRQYLAPLRFSRVVSSDLSRSRHTCEIIAGQQAQPLEVIPALREISLGEWEGVPFAEIKERFPKEYAARGLDMENWRPPGGESFADCLARVSTVLTRILAGSQGNVLLAGHAGVNRLILCSVLGIPLGNLHNIAQDYGCLNIIAFGANRAQIKLLNYTPLASLPLSGFSSRPSHAQSTVRKKGSASR
jgi:alpha-ribazole phosphatase